MHGHVGAWMGPASLTLAAVRISGPQGFAAALRTDSLGWFAFEANAAGLYAWRIQTDDWIYSRSDTATLQLGVDVVARYLIVGSQPDLGVSQCFRDPKRDPP